MTLPSKKTQLFVLVITAFVFSKAVFRLFDDPEGENLLIVVGLATILYVPSLIAYKLKLSSNQKPVVAFVIQLLLAVAVYFCM